MKAWVFLLACSAVAQMPNIAAIEGSGQDEASVRRGFALFTAQCARCHGPAAKGTSGETDLMRSERVRDDEKGERIGPVLRGGHPAGGVALKAGEIGDVGAFLRAAVYGVANRSTYEFLNILTGDAKKGEAYFQGAGKCGGCHSVTGDLKGIGEKYDPPVLQSLWLNPLKRRAKTVTVTPAKGPPVSGTLERLDEFTVVLRDGAGARRFFTIDNDEPRVEVHDPLQAHYDLYGRISDADVHNVTAFLAGVK